MNEDMTEQVPHLKTKQDKLEECMESSILGDLFGTSVNENLDAAATMEDVTGLNLLLGLFKAIEESIENNIAEIAGKSVLAGKVRLSNVAQLIVLQQTFFDASIILVSLPEDAGNFRVAGSSLVGCLNANETRSRGSRVRSEVMEITMARHQRSK